MNKFLKYILILSTSTILLLHIQSASAVGASPVRAQFEAIPGDIIKGQVNVQNTSDEVQKIQIKKSDFQVDLETEEVQFMLEADEGYQYSLQDWISIPQDTFTLQPGAKQVVPYEIHVPFNAESQGYYGSLLVETVPAEEVPLGASLGITLRIPHLVLLQVEGKLEYNIALTDFKINGEKTEDGLTQFEAVFFNNGNVHGAPEGTIEIIDIDGNMINEIQLNIGKNNVLPNSKKTFKVDCNLKDVLPGVYTAKLRGFTKENIEIYAELIFEIKEDGEHIMLGSSIGEGPGAELIPLRLAADEKTEDLQVLFITTYIIVVVLGLTFLVKFRIIKRNKKSKR